MNKIFIASTVSNASVLISLEDVLFLPPIGKLLVDDNWNEIVFCQEELSHLEVAIAKEIDSLGTERVIEDSKWIAYTELTYKGANWKLNYRNAVDFKIAILISFYDIVISSISRCGFVMIFNMEKIHSMVQAQVFNIIKLKRGVDENEIFNEIVSLSKEYQTISPISMDVIKRSVQNLMQMGFVDMDRKRRLYMITAKGYMFQI